MAKLNGDEIVAIIRAGHESKVAKLELGVIKITYLTAVETENLTQPIIPDTQLPPTDAIETAKPERPMQQELDEQLLNITDPVMFERMQLLNEKA